MGIKLKQQKNIYQATLISYLFYIPNPYSEFATLQIQKYENAQSQAQKNCRETTDHNNFWSMIIQR